MSLVLGIVERLNNSKKLRHLFFLGAALLAIFITGYHFGNWDQAVHIPYLAKYSDPTLFPGDPFLELRSQHFSFFWSFFIPFFRLGIIAQVTFVVHILATYATFWMIWELSNTLFNNPLTNVLCVITFIFPHLGMPGFLLIEFNLLNRSFVLPFLLAAIILFLRQRYWIAFLILGLMYNLHALSVNFVMAMVVFDCLLRIRTVKWRNLIFGLFLFILGALPILHWRDMSPIDFSLRPEMLSITSRGILSALYYIFTPDTYNLNNLVSGIACVALYLFARRRKPDYPYDRSIDNFMIAIGLVTLVAIIVTYWLPVTLILQFQILRICFFLLIFAYMYFCNFLVQKYQNGELSLGHFGVTLFAFATFISPLLPIIVWGIRKWLANNHNRQWLIAGGIAVIQIIAIFVAVSQHLWIPGFQIGPPKTAWVDVQLWAKNNTPKQARFITPPDMFQEYVPDWRVFSERSTVVSLPELMEVPFEPEYLPGWMQRFETIAPGAIAQFDGNVFNTIKFSGAAYNTLSSDDLLQIAKDYHASYVVVEKPHLHNFPIIYENKQFVVYDLTSLVNDP